jgi:pimeloyl-ACP methyl ester carboxylesterase
MLNKILFKIFGLFDLIKDFLIHWGIRILLVLVVCMLAHNIIKMTEITSFYQGDYKKLVSVYEDSPTKLMNVYTAGSGEKTIVILAGFGSQSPVIQYKTLVEGLKNEYRVAVVEYFGYGYSTSIKTPRTNENIALEIKRALEESGVYGPYVLMPHDTSNIYAMYFQEAYPDLVQGIVSIDGKYPKEIEDTYRAKEIEKYVSNINITSIFELTGFERVASYVSPATFYIDKMKAMTDIYSKEDISIYRNRIGSSYLSRTMVREINKLEDNMNEMKDYVYPEGLPVLEILASDTVNSYDSAVQNGDSSISLQSLAEGVISDTNVQKVEQVNGDKQLQLSNPTELLSSIKNFLISI